MAFRDLYTISGLPIFQNRMYDSEREARDCPTGDVHLAENLETGLVSNIAFNPELMNYDSAYQNEQGVSPLFKAHLDSVARKIQDTMGRVGLVEVGCGKGNFLELLLANGFDVSGFDPTYEGENPRVVKQYFHAGLGMCGEGLILRHVLEHIQNPYDFLLGLKNANGGRGKIYIEVPCFDWICANRTWFDIFYEHVNYFRLTDFYRLFGTVIDGSRMFGDQYLSVVADLSTLRPPVRDGDDPVIFPHDFTRGLKAENLQNSAVWGGASKGVLFSLLMERNGSKPTVVIDINPAKQGKYLPGSGLRVTSPGEGLSQLADGATIYVMNSNYLQEIKQMSGNRFNYVEVDHDRV